MTRRKTKTKVSFRIRFTNSYDGPPRRDYQDLEDVTNRREALIAFRSWLSEHEWWKANSKLVRVVTKEVVLQEKVIALQAKDLF